jgi:hypothetical protein
MRAVGSRAGAGLLAVPAAPKAAGAAVGSTTLGTVTLAAPSTTWNSCGCQSIPVTALVTGTRDADVDWEIEVCTRRSGSGAVNSWAWLWVSGDGSDRDTFDLCPFQGSGSQDVTGTVEFLDWATLAVESAPLATSFTICKMTSTARITEIPRQRSGTKVIGSVKARSAALGRYGAQGAVVVKERGPAGHGRPARHGLAARAVVIQSPQARDSVR